MDSNKVRQQVAASSHFVSLPGLVDVKLNFSWRCYNLHNDSLTAVPQQQQQMVGYTVQLVCNK